MDFCIIPQQNSGLLILQNMVLIKMSKMSKSKEKIRKNLGKKVLRDFPNTTNQNKTNKISQVMNEVFVSFVD